MLRLSLGSPRALMSGASRLALVLTGVLGVAALAGQVAPVTAHADAGLHYQPGYYVDNGWLCLGTSQHDYQSYRCTHHWHTADGKPISDNPSWVPNAGSVSDAPAVSTVHVAAPAQQVAAPVTHATYSQPAPAANYGSGSVQSEIAAVFGPYASQALAVARCESGFNPNAKNPNSTASGVFQFLTSTWATTSYAGYSPFDASANIHAAYQVFSRDGYSWREWQCQP